MSVSDMIRPKMRTPFSSNIADREYELNNEVPWQHNRSVEQAIDEEINSIDSIEAALYIRQIENRIQIADKNLKSFQDKCSKDK